MLSFSFCPAPMLAKSVRPWIVAFALSSLVGAGFAQTPSAASGVATPTTPPVAPEAPVPPVAKPAKAAASGQMASAATPGMTVPWSTLTKAQKDALAPLATSWSSLTEGQQRKWIAIAQNFNKLGPAEREKLHGRMADWAALSPKERERARLNFAQAKKVEPEKRAADWEAYQALSPEERKALADGAKKKPAGAATAPKTVPADKLAPVPVTRNSPDGKRADANSKAPLDRNTLLPKPTAPAKPQQSAASAPSKS